MPAKTFFAFPVLTALVVFALYFLTAFSDVPGGDAGELLAEGCSAGVAHPPGYPLYTMLLWTVTTGIRRLLMLGEEVDGGNAAVGTNSSFGEVPGAPAWRANVLSCALGAIAASFVCATVQIWSFLIWEKTHERLGSTRGAVLEGFAGMSAGLLFALSSLVWTYSITAEVFALNNALCAALLLGSAVCTLARERTSAGLACEHAPEIAQHLMDKGGDVDAQGKERVERERLERKRRSMDPTMIHTEGCAAALVASAAIAGLSLCNQHTALFFAAPLSLAEAVWWLYWALMGTRRSATNVRLTILNWLAVGILTGTAFFVLPHAYLVITALRGGVRGSWGNTGSVQGLIAHVLRREYGTFALSPMKNAGDGTTIAGLGERNEMFFEAWVNEEDTGFVLPLGSGLAATMGLASAFAVPSLTMRASRWQGKRHWLGARSLGLAVASFLALATYLIVFHSLANLPLDAPMPFEVHRRFWMQPALILCTWSGIGIRSFQIFIAGAFGLFRKSGRRRAIDALRLFGKIFRGGRNRSHSREHEEQKPKPKVDQGNRGKGKGGARGTRVAGRNSIKKKGKHKGAKARETGTTPQTAKSRSKSLQKLEEELPHLPWPRAQGWLRFLLYGMHTCIAVAAITTAAQRVGAISATLPHSLWPPSSWLAPTSLGYRVGGAMGRYGRALLSSIPEGALLLSHTDLNWNTVRYLQHCEGLRQDVTHLSLQLMPFPWFGTSNEPGRQSQLYPGVSFPNILPSASTQLGDAGNAALIVRFVEANAKRIAHGGIFLDLHAVSDAKIGAGGVYADRLRLLPHGLLWRVELLVEPETRADVRYDHREWQRKSQHALSVISSSMIGTNASGKAEDHGLSFSSDPLAKVGSWEHASAAVYWDGIYQAALHDLTLALSMKVSADNVHKLTAARRALYVESLERSARLLSDVTSGALGIGRTSSSLVTSGLFQWDNATRMVSFPEGDVWKNAALASVRFHQAAAWDEIVGKHKAASEETGTGQSQSLLQREERTKRASLGMLRALRVYVQNANRKDKDYLAFQGILTQIER